MIWPRPWTPCLLLSTLALSACGDSGATDDATTDDSASATSEGTDSSADAPDTDTATDTGDGDGDGDGIAGLELLDALAGLWTGPATMTPLGIFEPMNMDLRAADAHTLFCRADLDADNSLRFAFAIETLAGQDQLVYRNGGYFLGLLRDTRTILESHTPINDQGVGSYRFCALDGGCDYVDATWEFSGPDELVFDVEVQGAQHVLWIAERVEARSLPDPFPVDETPQGSGDAPFPPMPSLEITVSWTDPLAMPGDVWVLLSTQDCPLMGFCDFSRSIRGTAEAGATSLVLTVDQVHAGPYKANAILDRDQNLAQSLFPGSGDAVSLPNQAVEIAPSGTSMAELAVLVEL